MTKKNGAIGRAVSKAYLALTFLQVHLGEWFLERTLQDVAEGYGDLTRFLRHLKQSGYKIENDRKGRYRLLAVHPGDPAGMRAPVVGELRLAVFERDHYRCRICGATSDTCALVVDHVAPVEVGGPTILDNLQILCEPCNREKGAKIISVERTGAALRAMLTDEQRMRLVEVLL